MTLDSLQIAVLQALNVHPRLGHHRLVACLPPALAEAPGALDRATKTLEYGGLIERDEGQYKLTAYGTGVFDAWAR